MRLQILLVGLLAAATVAAAAPTPVSDLAKPPADAQRFTIMSTAGRHGWSTRWVTADGQHMARESLLLRGQVFEVDSASHLGADGMMDRVAVRGFTPNGDAGETFAIAGGEATWKSPVDAASAPQLVQPLRPPRANISRNGA